MNITRENTGDLTATIKIEIRKEDYEEKVSKLIKDYQRKANVPGFRPGKVPYGMVKKMYGNALKADEINKLISESIATYIEGEKLDVLGNPLPNSEKNSGVDFELQEEFDLYFDMGFAPDIPLSLPDIEGIERYQITVDDEMVERYLEDTRKRFGTSTNPEESGMDDMLRGDLMEIGENGQPVEDGIKKSSYIGLNQVKEGDAKNRLIGLHKEDKINIRPLELFRDAEEAAKLLGIEKIKAEDENLILEFTVNDIFHLVEAEMNPEFYQKVFPGLELESEEDFRGLRV